MKLNKNFDTGVMKFTFTDEDGDVFSSFKMNPTDINLLKRAEEVHEFFEKMKDNAPKNATTEEMILLNKEIEDKICYLLGYDAKEDIFGQITATTVSPDGKIFAMVVFEFIAEKLEPEMKKRSEKMLLLSNEYVEKYTK